MADQPWGADDIAALKRFFKRGLSGTEIGAELGRSRGSILGKIHRIRHSGALPEEVQREIPATVSLPVAVEPPAREAQECMAPRTPVPPTIPLAPPSVACDRLESFLALGPRSCRFPIGDPREEDFRFCGATTATQPYCEHHARIAFRGFHSDRRWN